MTINQSVRLKGNKNRNKKSLLEIKKNRTKPFLWNLEEIKNKPQLKGIVIKVMTITPKKPNSAIRKIARVKLNNSYGGRKYVTAYIPGEKHTLSVHNVVLIQPGRTQDLPGLRYKVIRGVLDCKK